MFEILFKKMAGTSEVLPVNVRPAPNNLFYLLPIFYGTKLHQKVYIIHMFEILFKKMAGTSEVLPVNVRPALPSYCQATPKNEDRDSSHAYEPVHAK